MARRLLKLQKRILIFAYIVFAKSQIMWCFCILLMTFCILFTLNMLETVFISHELWSIDEEIFQKHSYCCWVLVMDFVVPFFEAAEGQVYVEDKQVLCRL